MLAYQRSTRTIRSFPGNIYTSSTSGQYGSPTIGQFDTCPLSLVWHPLFIPDSLPYLEQLPSAFNTPTASQLPTSFSFDPTGQTPPVFHSYNNQPAAQYQNNFGFYPNQVCQRLIPFLTEQLQAAAQAFASAAQFAQQFAATTQAPAAQPVVAQIDQVSSTTK